MMQVKEIQDLPPTVLLKDEEQEVEEGLIRKGVQTCQR